jgi:anti-sigma factor RsiW
MTATPAHDSEWDDRLQDWLDGDVSAQAAAEIEDHLGDCTSCQERLAQFEALDVSLRQAAPSQSLDADFDAKVFALIDTISDAERIAARERMEAEFRDNLQRLSRNWRRTLGLAIPGVVAGIALAFAVTALVTDSGFTGLIAAKTAGEFGANAANWVQTMLTAACGAGVGLMVARWMAAAE